MHSPLARRQSICLAIDSRKGAGVRMTLRGMTASKFGSSVASGIGFALFSFAGMEAQAQTSIALDPIEVQSSRRGANRSAPGEQTPAPAQQDQQSPYGPGEGYTATRSA